MIWLYRKSFVPLRAKQLTEKVNAISSRIQQASAKLLNVFVKALLPIEETFFGT